MGLLYAAFPGASRSMNQSRCWAKERGARSLRGRRGKAASAAGAAASASRGASAAMVGASNRAARGRSTPKRAAIRARSWVARSEWPPRSKKLSWTPTVERPRSSCQIPASVSSSPVAGATYGVASPGRAWTVVAGDRRRRGLSPSGASASTGFLSLSSRFPSNTVAVRRDTWAGSRAAAARRRGSRASRRAHRRARAGRASSGRAPGPGAGPRRAAGPAGRPFPRRRSASARLLRVWPGPTSRKTRPGSRASSASPSAKRTGASIWRTQ